MILCYIYEGMADFEITLLLHRLKNTGNKECVFISEKKELINAQSGMSYFPDWEIREVKELEKVEALIIPGGPINNQQNDILEIIRQLTDMKKLVAAICFAPQFLGRAGVLNEYKFTTSCTAEKIKKLGIEDPFIWRNYLHQRVVADRNVITAQGFAFVDFAIAVCKYLKIYENERQLQEQLLRIKTDEM